MIYLYTGANGVGKTQFMLRHAVDLRGQSERPVYAVGVKGLDYVAARFFPLDQVSDWEKLPDGSIVIIDEAQDYIPKRDYKVPEPHWVKQLAKHRHRGFDFILGTPQGMMVDHFVRRLVSRHFHVKRKTMGRSLVMSWDTYQDKPDDFFRQRQGQKTLRKLDREMWKLYQSATLHTHKIRLPWQVALLFVLVPAVIFGVVKGVYGFTDGAAPGAAEAAMSAEAPPPAAGGVPASAGVEAVSDAWEWSQRFEPRIQGIPWSAPLYDGREVVSVPIPICIEVVGEHCRCYTQQMSRMQMPQDICLRIVHEGLFDPYREPFHFTKASQQAAKPPTEG